MTVTATAHAAARAAERLRKVPFKLISAILSIAVMLSACGEVSPRETAAPEPAASPQPVRREWKITSGEADASSDVVSVLCFSGDGYYFTLTEKTGEDIPYEVVRAAEKKGEKAYNDGRYDVFETSLRFITTEGKVKRLARYDKLAAPENTEGWRDFSCVTGISGAVRKNKSELVTLEYRSISGISRGAGGSVWEYKTEWFLRTVGAKTGREYSRVEVAVPEGMYFNGSGMMITADGTIITIAQGEKGASVCCISPEGDVGGEIAYGGTIKKSLRLGSGIYAVWGVRDGAGFISVPDFESQCFGDWIILQDGVSGIFSGDERYEFYCDCAGSVSGFDSRKGEYVKAFDWAEIGFDGKDAISGVDFESSIKAFFMTEKGGRPVCVRLEETFGVPDGVEAGTRLILLTADVSGPLRKAVSYCCSVTDGLSVEVRDVSLYTDVLGYASGIAEYISQELGGEMPDIIDISGAETSILSAAGMLEDLYPYIDSDPELNRGDYFPNVLSSLEYDGRLVGTCSAFCLETVIGSENVVGSTPGWTYAGLENALSGRQGMSAFNIYTSSVDVLRSCLYADMDSFADMKKREPSFEGEGFTGLLEFCSHFPVLFDASSHSWSDIQDNSDLRVRSGRQMLIPVTVYSMEDLMREGYEFGAPVTYVGYPVSSGIGNAIKTSSFGGDGALAMCSGSSRKDEAWRFLRTFFTEEYQKSFWYLPASRKLFERQLEDAMKVYYAVDRNGLPILDRKTGERIELSRGTMYLSDFTPVNYYAVTTEQAEKIRSLVEGAERTVCRDEGLINAICAAASGYFTGGMTAAQASESAQRAALEYFGRFPTG